MSARGPAKKSLLRRIVRPTVAAIAIVWLAYMCLAAFIVLVDPYDLYPWGAKVTAARRYDPVNAPQFISVAAKDQQADTVLIGTSPTALVTPEDIQAVFPDAKAAWNVSYLLAAPADRLAVIDQMIRYSHARHFILTVDYFYVLKPSETSVVFPYQYYDGDLTNDLRVVEKATLLDSLRALRRGTPFPDVAATTAEMDLSFTRVSNNFHRPEELASLAASIGRVRPVIDVPSNASCASFPMLPEIERRVRTLAERGAKVDLLIPAFSPSAYYRWLGNQNRELGEHALADQYRQVGDHALYEQLLMRRCLVRALDGVANVAVTAADQDFPLVNRLANFYDPTHLTGGPNLRRMLGTIRDPRFRLTAANVDAYAERIRRNVKAYCPSGFPDAC